MVAELVQDAVEALPVAAALVVLSAAQALSSSISASRWPCSAASALTLSSQASTTTVALVAGFVKPLP